MLKDLQISSKINIELERCRAGKISRGIDMSREKDVEGITNIERYKYREEKISGGIYPAGGIFFLRAGWVGWLSPLPPSSLSHLPHYDLRLSVYCLKSYYNVNLVVKLYFVVDFIVFHVVSSLSVKHVCTIHHQNINANTFDNRTGFFSQ